MTYGAFTSRDFAPFELDARRRPPVVQPLLCAALVVLSVSAGTLLLFSRPPAATAPTFAPLVKAEPVAPRSAVLPAAAAVSALRREASLLDPALTASQHPMTFALSAPLRSVFEPHRMVPPAAAEPASAEAAEQVAEIAQQDAPSPAEIARDIPLPAPRPVLLTANEAQSGSRRRPDSVATPQPTAPLAAPERPGFFEKMFGRPAAPGPALAYAAPDDGGLTGGLLSGRRPAPDGTTAIYDIAAHTVYLPDGTRLEAHSGIGPRKDDPRSVAEHMRGATPPNVYQLTYREAPFHGVRALRLIPTSGTTYGRAGLLAHTYMLGPNGDSNGCVVFRDYRTFLAAYERGQIRQLAVVARLN